MFCTFIHIKKFFSDKTTTRDFQYNMCIIIKILLTLHANFSIL